LSTELDQAHALTDGITNKRIVEAMRLSQCVVGISNALADLGMLPVRDIPQLPKLAREILSTTDLVF
jgi:hypothetical protein